MLLQLLLPYHNSIKKMLCNKLELLLATLHPLLTSLASLTWVSLVDTIVLFLHPDTIELQKKKEQMFSPMEGWFIPTKR